MNKIYRVVWSAALGLWVVASETTRSRKKGRVRRALQVATASALTSWCSHLQCWPMKL
ncbi:hypothetical protein FCM30_03595 [Lelliottia aquatilis]|uniref:ESPR domain-containing protein n=1 Tax=Lelliottia aquatilis TaxID=2080838 RepID=UPI001575D0E9|nr:ESPR domain-containing protein [Lelliottia aquatilis]NTZ44852.1 hypothetical protein [Lelliottia aquatilis]